MARALTELPSEEGEEDQQQQQRRGQPPQGPDEHDGYLGAWQPGVVWLLEERRGAGASQAGTTRHVRSWWVALGMPSR